MRIFPTIFQAPGTKRARAPRASESETVVKILEHLAAAWTVAVENLLGNVQPGPVHSALVLVQCQESLQLDADALLGLLGDLCLEQMLSRSNVALERRRVRTQMRGQVYVGE